MPVGNLLTGDLVNNKGKKHSGFSATVSSSFSKTRIGGIAWDGTDVYYASDNPANKLWKGTGFAATVQDSFSAPGSFPTLAYDIDWDGSNLLAVAAGTKAYKFQGFSSTITTSITYGASLRGIAWDGSNVIVNDTGVKVAKMSGFSASVSDSFTSNLPSIGLTWDGTDLYGSVEGSTKIRQYTGFSSTVASSITATDAFGLDWDTFPSNTLGTLMVIAA